MQAKKIILHMSPGIELKGHKVKNTYMYMY